MFIIPNGKFSSCKEKLMMNHLFFAQMHKHTHTHKVVTVTDIAQQKKETTHRHTLKNTHIHTAAARTLFFFLAK
jgi:hypothetical protein